MPVEGENDDESILSLTPNVQHEQEVFRQKGICPNQFEAGLSSLLAHTFGRNTMVAPAGAAHRIRFD